MSLIEPSENKKLTFFADGDRHSRILPVLVTSYPKGSQIIKGKYE